MIFLIEIALMSNQPLNREATAILVSKLNKLFLLYQ